MAREALEYNVDYRLLDNSAPINILAVEDDNVSMQFLESQIAALGHNIVKAFDGESALRILSEQKDSIDVVLMDREMPVMDGLTAVMRIKENRDLRNIPVVMVTSADSKGELTEGLDAGVFYYLTKPVDDNILRSVLAAAIREAQQNRTLSEELSKHKASFDLIDTCKFKFRTLAEAESLAAFIANCFLDTERVLSGLGELLINAIEHGNLGLGYERKTALIDNGTWRAEIERMLESDKYANRYATATVAHKEDGVYVIIEDQGEGFQWQRYMTIDPARAGDNHGRGIAQANTMSFDKLKYNEKGNQAVAYMSRKGRLEW